MNIAVENVSLTSDNQILINNVSFIAHTGKVLGILGPQNAGKSTLLRMILNMTKPDSGKIEFNGKQISTETKDSIGYLPEKRGIYQNKRVIDVLIYFGQLKNMPYKKANVEAIRLLDRLEMIEYMEESISNLNVSLQQKLLFIMSILHDPKVLILDEPFMELEPLNQDVLQKMIFRFREEGKTVILATRQLNKAEKVCDEVLFLENGNRVLKGNLESIREKFKLYIIGVESDGNLRLLKNIQGIKKCYFEKQHAKLFVDEKIQAGEVLQEIIGKVNISRVEVNRPTLEDIYSEVIKNGKL
jgi:ABC-2 type transport system ATP-binding protein